MNKARRKALGEIYDALALLAERLEELIDEENEALGNVPESLQGSNRYQSAEEAVNNLEIALEILVTVYEYIVDAIEA